MAMERSNHLQEAVYSASMAEKSIVTIYLLNGVKLIGAITGYDQFTLLLERDGICQQVEKSAIAAVSTSSKIGSDAEL